LEYSVVAKDSCYLEGVEKADGVSGNTLVVSMLSWLDTYGSHWGCTQVSVVDTSSIKEVYILTRASFYYQSWGFRYDPADIYVDECTQMTSFLFGQADLSLFAEKGLLLRFHEALLEEEADMLSLDDYNAFRDMIAAEFEPLRIDEMLYRTTQQWKSAGEEMREVE